MFFYSFNNSILIVSFSYKSSPFFDFFFCIFHCMAKICKIHHFYVVYDLVSSGNKEKMLQGKTILLGILDAFESTRNQFRPLEVSFFAREKFFDSIRILKENKLMDAELRQLSESLVSQMSFCEERGPNNRAANYAMGALALINSSSGIPWVLVEYAF